MSISKLRITPTPSNTPSYTPTITPSLTSCPTYGWDTNIKLFECNYGQPWVGLPLTGWTVEHSGITYSGLTQYTTPQAATWCNIPVQEPFIGASYIFNLTEIADGWELCANNNYGVAWDSFEVVLTGYTGRICFSLTECLLEYPGVINYYLGGVLQYSQPELIQFTEYLFSENPDCPPAFTMFNQVMMFIVDVIRPTTTPTPTMTMTPSPTPLCEDILNFSLYSGPPINALQGNYTRQFSNSATTFTYGYFSGGTPPLFFTGATFDTGQNYPVYMIQSGSTYSVLGRTYITSSNWRWQIFTTTGSSYLDYQRTPIGSLQITPNEIAYDGMYIIPEGLNTYIGRTYNIDYPASCITPTPTATPTMTSTPTSTSPNVSPTNTSTPTITPTNTITPTSSSTPGVSPTNTSSPTMTSTPTNTPSNECLCFSSATINVSVGGSITFNDCNGNPTIENFNAGDGQTYGDGTFCIQKDTNGGTAEYTIVSYNDCCSPVITPTSTPTNTTTPSSTPTQTSTPTNTPTGTIVLTPTNTQTSTPTPTSASTLCIDVQTNISLDITLNMLTVNGNSAYSVGGVWPNTPGNGASLLVAGTPGTYDVEIFYTSFVAGQHIAISSPLTGYACQNTTTGSGSVLFTGVGFSNLGCLQVIAQDGTC